MRNAALSVLGFGLLSVCSPAQEPAVFYKPGDTVRIVVSFKSPVSLSEGRFFFRLQDKLQETQHGFQTEFNGGQFSKSTDAEYEVSGVVGENIASGMWRLEIIDVFSAGVMNR